MKIVQKFDLDKLAYGMHTYMITEIVFDLIGGGGGVETIYGNLFQLTNISLQMFGDILIYMHFGFLKTNALDLLKCKSKSCKSVSGHNKI